MFQESLKFECVKNPTAAKVTLEVFGETETECSTTSPPSYRLPVYEGCNEDFPVIMDLRYAKGVGFTAIVSNVV